MNFMPICPVTKKNNFIVPVTKKSSAVAKMVHHLATIDISRKLEGAVPLSGEGELDPI